MSKFIEERLKLVRSLAEKADPFIKPRLLLPADRYEQQLSPTVPPPAVHPEIKMEPGVPPSTSLGKREARPVFRFHSQATMPVIAR